MCSMLSAQVDELRELAGDGSMEWVVGPIRASMLRDAADTISELRGMVHKERAEADRLRELVRNYYVFEHGDCHSCRYHDECRKDESCRCIAPMRLADRTRELGVDDG